MSAFDRFGRLGEIDPGRAETWQDRIFLSFDIDWAHDDVVHDTIDFVEGLGVGATWFATHLSPTLDRLRANPLSRSGFIPISCSC